MTRLREPVLRALRDAGVKAAGLDQVVLIGGATRMPVVRQAVAKMFGRFPALGPDPDEAVALGAAIQAGLKARDAALREVVLTDVCPYSLGVDVGERLPDGTIRSGLFEPIIERNTVVPASRVKSFGTMNDRQRQVEFGIFQGESRHVAQNIRLGTITIPVPAAKAGEVQVDCRFTYDINGLLEVDVEVAGTGERRALTIVGDGVEGMGPYGLIEDAALCWQDGLVTYCGPMAGLPDSSGDAVDCEGGLVTPALIDCHTHLIFAGDRAREFEQRLEGVSYEQIARNGGGILSTVRATRAADNGELLRSGMRRMRALMQDGVSTIEIKSGYGLDLDTERRILNVARALGTQMGMTIRTTYLGAHALPPEFDGRPDDYIDAACDWLRILHAEGLVDAVDAFCEGIGSRRHKRDGCSTPRARLACR